MRYGLIGGQLGHSHSPAIHRLLADYPYELYPLPEGELASFLSQPDLGGVNVTIPYKKAVIPLCDQLSPIAQRIGSVNTLVRRADGTLWGHNTDYGGFLALCDRVSIHFAGKKVLILGSGGTSATARQAALDRGAGQVVIISRRGEDNYQNLSRHSDCQILVNTTPVGMFPEIGQAPLSLDWFAHLEGVIDVIYNPLRTRLVLEAQRRGIPAAGGLAMLVAQAREAAACFCGHPVGEEAAEKALHTIGRQVENIVLVGMPGCGKSSIGAALARLSGRRLIDTDREIERSTGQPVPQIFAQQGEAAFRALERQAIAQAAGQSGVVIATGGGSVLDAQNRLALRQNGRVYFIWRPLEQLPIAGRPVSMGTPVQQLYAQRLPLYQEVADWRVDNLSTIEEAAKTIWEEFL